MLFLSGKGCSEFPKRMLIPIGILNMRSHHAKTVTEYLDKAGIHYAYLPPYSPDLNPIEKMWSKMKAILRKQKVRVASELPEAVKKVLEMIRHTDCEGWFHAYGYMH